MGGLDIINRDKHGRITQDYHVSRSTETGKIVEENTLKSIEEQKIKEENQQ